MTRREPFHRRRVAAASVAATAVLGAVIRLTSASAQSGEVLALGLQQAVERAVATSPQVAGAGAQQQAAAAGLRGARAARWPQVDLTAGYMRTSDIPELVLTLPGVGARTLFPNIPDNTRARVGLQLPLYTGGRVGAQVAAAEGEWRAAGSEASAARADLALETSMAYWELVAALERQQVAASAVDTYEAHVRDARNRLELGLTARNEVLAVEVERDRAELARLDAVHDAHVAQANLQRLLDVPATTSISPTEQLDRPAPAAEQVEPLVTAALASRPERAAAQARVDAAVARARAERAARYPQVAAAGGYDWAHPNREILPPHAQWDDTWDVGVNLSLNVFDGGRIGAGVARAVAQAEVARQALRALDGALRLQVTEAALTVQTAQQAVVVAERAQAAAQENRRVAADRYREGVIPSAELLDAETALLSSGLDLTRARTQLQVSVAALQHAVGRAS